MPITITVPSNYNLTVSKYLKDTSIHLRFQEMCCIGICSFDAKTTNPVWVGRRRIRGSIPGRGRIFPSARCQTSAVV
jgi:hypothetical protein